MRLLAINQSSMSVIKVVGLILMACSVSACALVSGAGIKGASSMTIDVEVYKGPLSKTLQVQQDELQAQAEDVTNVLYLVEKEAALLSNRKECGTDWIPDIGYVVSGKPVNTNRDKRLPITKLAQTCFIGAGIAYDAKELRSQIEKNVISSEFTNSAIGDLNQQGSQIVAPKSVRNFDSTNFKVKNFSRIGAQLRTRSDYWATKLATTHIRSKKARALVADFVHYTSEFGNQIVSRADALLLQTQNNICRLDDEKSVCPRYPTGLRIAGLLSTGYFLRDSGTTNYLNLYDWADAIPGRAGSLGSGVSKRIRVRTVQQLINDTYWSNINSVYASGQGNVSMAFIKDSIGNWNLKSFENDPAELLEAYDRLAISSVRQAAKVAKGVVSGGSSEGVDQLLRVASSAVATDAPEGGTLTSANLQTFRTMLVENINALEKRYDMAKARLDGEIAALDPKIRQSRHAKLLLGSQANSDRDELDTRIADITKDQRMKLNCGEEEASTLCADLPEQESVQMRCARDNIVLFGLEGPCAQREAIDLRLQSIDANGVTPAEACAQDIAEETPLADNCANYSEMQQRKEDLLQTTIREAQRFVADHKAVVNALQLAATTR